MQSIGRFVVLAAACCSWTAQAMDIPAGRYLIQPAHSGKCLDVGSGGQLTQQACSAGLSQQQFDIAASDSGYFKILSAASGQAIDISSSSTADGTAADSWPYFGGYDQQYFFIKNGSGYVLKPRHSGKCLDLKDWSADDGGLLQQWSCTGAANQTYLLVPTGGDTASVANGRYTLRAEHSNLCLDVPNSSLSNYVQLQQWSCNGTAAQQWDGNYVGGSRYEVRNVNSGKCVDLDGAWTYDGNEVQQYDCNQTNAQRWKIEGAGDGAMFFKSALDTNKVWDVTNVSTAPGARIQIWSLNGGAANKRWWMDPVVGGLSVAEGNYSLRNVNSSKCVDVSSSSTSPGVQLQQWSCSGADNQRFAFTYIGDGYYRIVNVNSGLALQVRSFGISTGWAIEQAEAHGGDNQLFKLEAYGAGYRLKPKHSYLCVDVTGSSPSDGALLQQYSCNGSNAQVFKLENGPAAPPAGPAAVNNYPIVLVHGVSGWGRSEMLGLKYWGGGFADGGPQDLQEVLKASGYPTYTVAVGPWSSVQDRAIEAFYQIKGGCVDYGAYHSTHLVKIDGTADSRTLIRKLDGGLNADGTRRPRKCWAADAANNPDNDPLALYPQWGNDPGKKIHLIGHSLGAPTIRVLLQLLRNGDPNELAADASLYNEATQKNPYTGGKNWVSSLTSMTGTMDGASIDTSPLTGSLVPLLNGTFSAVAALAGLSSTDSLLYDFKLEQWGLQRAAGETLSSYLNRVKTSPIFVESRNTALWDITPEAARDLNQQIQTFSDVYYFSYAGQSTWRGWFTGHHYPILATNPIMMPISVYVGQHTSNLPGKVVIDSSWWPSDGALNTRTERSPAGAPWVNYSGNGTPQPGTWNYLGILQGWDHLDITGLLTEKSPATVNALYLSHASRLRALGN